MDRDHFIREYIYGLSETHKWKAFCIEQDFSNVSVKSECYSPFEVKLKIIGKKSSAGYVGQYDEEKQLIIVTPADSHNVYWY